MIKIKQLLKESFSRLLLEQIYEAMQSGFDCSHYLSDLSIPFNTYKKILEYEIKRTKKVTIHYIFYYKLNYDENLKLLLDKKGKVYVNFNNYITDFNIPIDIYKRIIDSKMYKIGQVDLKSILRYNPSESEHLKYLVTIKGLDFNLPNFISVLHLLMYLRKKENYRFYLYILSYPSFKFNKLYNLSKKEKYDVPLYIRGFLLHIKEKRLNK